uniref:C2H2-type domain-containing protein n=1 Tax=Heliothis virescens TaxID=7102 RepID=A0A2A4IX20_HELVI
MASRILFEEEVSGNKDKNIKMMQEHTNQDQSIQDTNNLDNNEQTDIHNDSQTQETVTRDEKINDKTPNHQVDNSTANIANVIQENSTNNTLTDMDPAHSNSLTTILPEVPVGQSGITPSSAQGPIVKVKKKSELELLGVDVKAMEECDTQFDAFEADRQICRKYKLRKMEQQISYKEPANFPLKRSISSEELSDEPPSLTCPVCNHTFDSLRALKVHEHYHGVTTKEFTCSICSENFKKNADLLAHKVIHSGESFVCQRCKLAFSDHCDFLLHNAIHAGTSDIKCPECGLLYNRRSYYHHIKTHFSKKHKCPKCSFVTNFEENLESHDKKMHSSTYECVECRRTLKSKAQFDYHMSTHTGVKKHQCLYCGKGFATQNQRIVHTRVHTGEKPYSCDICGYRASQTTDIKRHKMTHETEKKFSCEVCSKKFLRKESLLGHMTSHTKKDMFECPACDHRYTSSVGLRVHIMMKHTNERPVECTFCNKKFVNNNQYRKHTRTKIHKRRAYGHMKLKGDFCDD